jgi:hypothetical protein
MRKALPDGIPEQGVKWDEIQPDIEKIIMVQQALSKWSCSCGVAGHYALATSQILFLVPM